jgi:hypothetical protein
MASVYYYPQMDAVPQHPASKWEPEGGTCPSSSSCLASEVRLVGSFC